MVLAAPGASVTQKVRSSPVGSTSTSATASALSGPQAVRQGRAAKTLSFGSASKRPHQALSGARQQTATPPEDFATTSASSGRATWASGGGAPPTHTGH